jgi:predicted short-subunit dehydrogenase-like oxidoreductase (DUF2520 family)
MRQVPHYTIIGDGRMARHFSHYLQLLGIPFLQWSRRLVPQKNKLSRILEQSDRILLLISDSAIESFIKENIDYENKTLIHFSGALVTPLAFGAHPLMSFSNELYQLEDYQKIPFIIEEKGKNLSDLLPGLPNPYFFITAEKKALYHAYCVMSGNFTSILWKKFFNELQDTFQLPKDVAYPYMESIFQNLRNNPNSALTGPLARNDQQTIKANLEALINDSFQKIYQAFVDIHFQEKNT